ncbi:MAG: hypothetical protein ACK4E4_05465, partial [Rhodocyclaceae bacterium]
MLRGEGTLVNGTPLKCDPGHTITHSVVAIGASHRTDPAHIGHVLTCLMREGGMFYRNGSGA